MAVLGKKIPDYMKSPTQVQKEKTAKKVKKIKRKVKKFVTKGNIDVPKIKKKVVKTAKKVTKATKKVAKSTGARIASVASKAIRSPVGKFGPLGAAVTLAYYAGEEFSPKKASAKTTTTKKPTAKSVPSSFGSAFKKAYKDNPGGTFTYKGKKYKAAMKKPRKEDKGVSQSDIIGGKGRVAGGMMKKYKEGSSISFTDAAKKVKKAREDKKFYKKYLGETDASYKARIAKKEKLANKKSRSGNIGNIDMSGFGKRKLSPGEDKIRKSDMMGDTPLGMSVDEKKKAKKYDPTKANRAGQRMGQRKAGGIMKKSGAAVSKAELQRIKNNLIKQKSGAAVSDAELKTIKKNLLKKATQGKMRPMRASGKKKAGGIAKKYNKGGLKDVPTNKQKSLGQLPTDVRNNMGFKMSGGMAKKKMMGGGMMKYKNGTGKKGVAVQARGCGAVLSKRKTRVT